MAKNAAGRAFGKVVKAATSYGGFVGSLGARSRGRNAEDLTQAVKFSRSYKAGTAGPATQKLNSTYRIAQNKISGHKKRLAQGKGVSSNPRPGGVRMSELLKKK